MTRQRIVYAREKAQHIKPLFHVVKEMLAECYLEFTQDGLFIKGTDPEKVTLLDVRLLNLSAYECVTPTKIGVFTAVLYKIVRQTEPNDEIEFVVYPAQPQDMFINIVKKDFNLTTVLPSVEVHQGLITTQDRDFPYEVDVPTKTLYKMLKEVSQFCQTIKIESLSQELPLTIKSMDYVGSIYMTTTPTQWTRHPGDPYEGEFMAKYMERFCKSEINKTTTLLMDHNSQIVLRKSLPFIGNVSLHVASVMSEAE